MATSTVTSIGTTATDPSSLSSSLAVTGLASGMNWSTVVSELANAERAPETQWEQEQNTNSTINSAYTTILGDLTTLQTDASTLMDPSFFRKVAATSSNTAVATVAVSSGSPTGTYVFNISQLATAAVLNGASYVSQVLDPGGDPSSVTVGAAGFSTPVTAGTFTVDGNSVTLATTDSLQDVFNAIATATSNKVSASYDATTDTISLTSSDGSPIVLGSSADTSNFLQVAQLYNDNGKGTNNTGTITSTGSLGHVSVSATLSNADLATAITDDGSGSGSGSFMINGVTFNYNTGTDSIQDILNNINSSAAGVSASYDKINNRFVLTNSTTGDVGVSMKDLTGNFLAATGLSGGTLAHGKNLLYTINNSSQQIVSQSNTISSANSGITGVSVTALSTGATTVAVSTDTATISQAIQKFVTDYNTAQTYMSSQEAVTTASDGTVTAGTLTGDSTTNDLISSLRSILGQVGNLTGTSGAVQQLSDLGFQSNGNDNTIALNDSSTLTAMLTNHLSDVQAFFSDATNGMAVQMNTYISNATGPTGELPTRQADLTQENTDISTQISNLETKIANDTAQWNSEFQAMETAESQTNQELTYISQGVSNGSL